MDQMSDKYNKKLHDISICSIKGSKNSEEFMGSVALSGNYMSSKEKVQENKKNKKDKQKHQHKKIKSALC